MNRSPILVGALFLAAAAIAWTQARAPVDADTEPHHHLMLANGQVRVFAVSIPAGQDIYVRHQHNFLTVTLEDGRLVMWIEGANPGLIFPVNAGDTRFFLGGPALGMRNDGRTRYKNITVDFLDPQVTTYAYQNNRTPDQPSWDYGSSGAMAPPVDARSGFVHALSLRVAVARDVRLLPGEQFAPPNRPANELFIAVTDLDLAPPDGEDLKKQPGEVSWLERRTSALVNQGKNPVRFVVLELKRPSAGDVELK
jgi:hypothetical protein